MNRLHRAFADELTKVALLGPLGYALKKHPIRTIGMMAIPAVGTYGAVKAYRSGRSGTRGRQLEAEPGKPSQAALINYNRLVGKNKINKHISDSYKKDAF